MSMFIHFGHASRPHYQAVRSYKLIWKEAYYFLAVLKFCLQMFIHGKFIMT